MVHNIYSERGNGSQNPNTGNPIGNGLGLRQGTDTGSFGAGITVQVQN